MKHLPPSRETPQPDEALNGIETKAALEAVRRTSLLLAITPCILLAITFGVFKNANLYGVSVLYASLMLSLLGWIAVALSYWTKPATLAMALTFLVQAIAIYAIVSFGSIRAAGSVLFLATVVAAGTFLGRGALLVALLTSLTAIGAATYAEVAGIITPDTVKVGFLTWFTHAAVLSAVAMLVFYARQRTRNAYQQQIRALEDNKRLAQERDRSLDRFTRVFRSNPSPMITQRAGSAEILDVNPAFERCYGYSREEVVGQTDEVLWGQPLQRRSYLQGIAQNKRVAQVNVSGIRKDGTLFNAQISSELSDEGDDSLVITTVADITAQVSAIERLQRSEDRFSKAFNFSPLKLIITRLNDDTVIEMNRADHRERAVSMTDYRGRPALEAGPWFKASDRVRFVQRLLENGHLSGYSTSLTRPDGSTIDAKIWAEQIDIDGEPCILSCIVDTTEEKRRNELLHDIAKGMIGHSAQAFFKSLTQRMANALDADTVFVGEITPDRRVTTLSVFKNGAPDENGVFPLAGNAYEQSLFQQTLSVHPAGLSNDPECQTLLKGTGIEAAVYQALHDSEGQPIGILSAMWTHSITATDEMRSLMAIFASRAHAELMRLRSERKIEQLNSTLEQRVMERTADLSKLNAELDSFAYSISHDLKSPLRAIDGFTQLLHERLGDRLDAEEGRLMDRVLGATHRMATLMADLLALARVSQLPMHVERLNLSVLAEDELKRCLEKSPRSQLRWHIELGLIAYADLAMTRVVLRNLLENALQFTRDQAAPLIEVGRVEPSTETPGAVADFFVRDNGVGFSMAHADKLFKPFQRLHMPSAGFEGTGIGLATVRRIVERHGGTISGTATPNNGAEFRFSLARSPLHSSPTP